MDTLYTLFKKDIVELQKYITYTDKKIRESEDQYLHSLYKKKIDYKIIIISLYGYLELYISSLIKSYLETLENNIFSYSFFSPTLKAKHFFNSISLSNKILEKKGTKYENINVELVIDNLNSCIRDTNYSFNKDAFIIHTGNLKHQKVCDLFKDLNINLSFLLNNHDNYVNQTSENKFFIIDDLVDRRNEISHGDTDNLLNLGGLKDYINFVDEYIRIIKDLLKADIHEKTLNYKLENSLLLEQVQVFPNKVLGILDKKISINKRKHLIIIKTDKEVHISKIIDKNKHAIGTSLKLEKNLRKTFKYYLFNKELYKSKSLNFF